MDNVPKTRFNFSVNPDTLVFGYVDREVSARQDCLQKAKKNPGTSWKQWYKAMIERDLINTPQSVRELLRNNARVLRDERFFGPGNNIVQENMLYSALTEPEGLKKIKKYMGVVYELSEEEQENVSAFFSQMYQLKRDPVIAKKVEKANQNRAHISRLWKDNEEHIMSHIARIVGDIPEFAEKKTSEVDVLLLDSKSNTQRTIPLNKRRTVMIYGKDSVNERETDVRTLASLTHQAIHQPILPYKPGMTEEDKKAYHAFIKFLTDKEVYTLYTGRSALALKTVGEDSELMGLIYPYYLGYKYRNARAEGLDPVKLISAEIARDKQFYDSITDMRVKKRFASYEFEQLDPKKIAHFFVGKRNISPYKFAQINFHNRYDVIKDRGAQAQEAKVPDMQDHEAK